MNHKAMHVGGKDLLHWLVLAAAIWILIAAAIPWRGFKRVWLPGFLTGFIMTYPINYLAVGYLGMWHFPKNALTFLHTPFFLALSWFGAIVVFDYMVLVHGRLRIVFIFAFSLLTVAIFADAAAEGHLKLGHWALAETYFLSVITHSIALSALKLFVRDRRLRPGTEPPLA